MPNALLCRVILLTGAAIVTACGSISGPSHAGSPSDAALPARASDRSHAAVPSNAATPARTSALRQATAICRTAGLKISLVHTGAAAGTLAGDLLFVNDSGRICRLAGWPRVAGLSAAGAVAARNLLTTEFGPVDIRVPSVVTLKPGAAAVAVIVGNDVVPPCSTGEPRAYRQLRVTPPGNSQSVKLSAWFPFLGRFLPQCGHIAVTPVVPQATIYGS